MYGDNTFDDRFDYYKWGAPIYETPEEILKALLASGCLGKTLKGVNVIGHINSYVNPYEHLCFELDEDGEKDYSDVIDQVLCPCEVTAYEPIQFVFEDGTTLDLLPMWRSARIDVNSIPVGMVDGMNHSDYDVNKLAPSFSGTKLNAIRLEEVTKTKASFSIYPYSKDINSPYQRTETFYSYVFEFDHPGRIRIIAGSSNRFDIQMIMPDGSDRVTYGEMQRAGKPVQQVEIIPGQEGGGTFWITAFSSKEDVYRRNKAGISIDDLSVSSFLGTFLYKHLDKSIQEREDYENEGFEEYGQNYYTFESIHGIIEEIRQTISLLESDYDDPSLDEIKRHYSIVHFADKETDICSLSDEEKASIIKQNKYVAIDFYERFVEQMEKILELSPDCDMVTFSGP